ncbi:thioesterase II family protein [Streptosporangium sp. NPDC000396]|uniref:thioesterase II family protein n=1 Tax=Streptosporangium sp. NPDC000396 TaxID=3366185 RepID=UPI0036955C90
MADLDTPWLRRHRPSPGAGARIICFGPAGASANLFRGWAVRVSADVEVLSVAYPGRERRFEEPAIEEMETLAGAVADVLASRLRIPTVLFGHSMGASVAFEVTRRLEAGGSGRPVGLVLSGRQSPALQRERPSDAADYDDRRIIEHLRELGGTPPEMLEDPDFRELVLPAFRTDFRLVGRYLPELEPMIDTPLSVVLGDRDPGVPVADADRWREVARRFAGIRTFPGEHFYLLDQEEEVVSHVVDFLTARRAEAWSRSPVS